MSDIPFMLDKGEEMLKEANKVNFVVGSTHNDNLGRLILTNRQLAVVQPQLFNKNKLFALFHLDSLVSVEPYEIGILKLKRRGFKVIYRGPQGEIQEIRVYNPDSRLIYKQEQVQEWVTEWVRSIQEAFRNK